MEPLFSWTFFHLFNSSCHATASAPALRHGGASAAPRRAARRRSAGGAAWRAGGPGGDGHRTRNFGCLWGRLFWGAQKNAKRKMAEGFIVGLPKQHWIIILRFKKGIWWNWNDVWKKYEGFGGCIVSASSCETPTLCPGAIWLLRVGKPQLVKLLVNSQFPVPSACFNSFVLKLFGMPWRGGNNFSTENVFLVPKKRWKKKKTKKRGRKKRPMSLPHWPPKCSKAHCRNSYRGSTRGPADGCLYVMANV